MNPYDLDEYDDSDYYTNPENFCPLCMRHEDYCECAPEIDDDADQFTDWDDPVNYLHTEQIDLSDLGISYGTFDDGDLLT